MTRLEYLRNKANSLPEEPGVYIMKNAEDKIIYVGKSKKLKNRVTSYFTGTHSSLKTMRLVSLVKDFDYILCKTEIEALTLENVLIKRHSPKYNIKLKDAKSYPYIKITDEEYPRLTVTRERRADKARYFGPYQSTAAAYGALETVMKTFSLPTCNRAFPKDIKRGRPCLYKDMGSCIAVCAGGVSSEDYRELVKLAERVLDGDIKATAQRLEGEMLIAAEEERFEKAAALRDSISALKKLSEKQKVVSDEKINRDVFSLYTSETEGALATLSIRGGALINKTEFILSLCDLTSPSDALTLIADYYENAGSIPKEVVIDFTLDASDISLLSDYLSYLAGKRVTVRKAERGNGRALCELARKNAMEAARQYRLEGERENKSLARFSVLLGLPKVPDRVEAYDISNIGDEHISASMVVWQGGRLKKSDYRSFNITSVTERDDYASMREVISRRLANIGEATLSLGERPDLILIDGGAGHVNAVRPILESADSTIALFGMVKDDYHKTRAITDGEHEISIAHEANVYAFVYNLQEEAHRFALKKSSGAKRKSLVRSSLEKIKGIGPKKAKLLLAAMPLSMIRAASADELSSIKGVSKSDAQLIYEYYHKKK